MSAPFDPRPLLTADLSPVFRTSLGALFSLDCLELLPALVDGSIDLVFCDPPYASEAYEHVLGALFRSPLIGGDSTVVVEGARRHPLPAIAGARVVDERRYGDTVLTWLARVAADGGPI